VRYRAKSVNLVMHPPAEDIGSVEVQQDGKRLDYAVLGDDVRPDGDAMVATVDLPRMYNLINNPQHGIHELRLQVKSPGLSVYAMSFTTECRVGERSAEEAA